MQMALLMPTGLTKDRVSTDPKFFFSKICTVSNKCVMSGRAGALTDLLCIVCYMYTTKHTRICIYTYLMAARYIMSR
jgi:hypothetical protein